MRVTLSATFEKSIFLRISQTVSRIQVKSALLSVPVTTSLTISSGRATSTMSFDHYAEVPAGLAKEVIEKSGYKNSDDDE